jgi:hypothetical protein
MTDDESEWVVFMIASLIGRSIVASGSNSRPESVYSKSVNVVDCAADADAMMAEYTKRKE